MQAKVSLNPLGASDAIHKSYRRYLLSRHAPNSANLMDDFQKALDGSFPLTKGPLLQASAPFEPGVSIRELVDSGTLNHEFVKLGSDAFPIERPLHHHQEEAIRKIIAGRNLVVATGTGSGKTECYLFPILDHLLQEQADGTLKESGVRAMLLYPMNALANDQMKRLRSILSFFPDVTFGRFVGDTRERHQEALEIYKQRFGADPLSNEYISREQIRETPPHILLTNYAMLERLLLYPSDTSLFDGSTGRHWKFVVLDEVHVYNGAQAAEIAMLLRRVRDRVHQSEKGRIQYIGTSATLASSDDDFPRLAKFAEILFDETLEYDKADSSRQDIVLARHQPLVQKPATWSAEAEDFSTLLAALDQSSSPQEMQQLLSTRGAPVGQADTPTLMLLGDMLTSEHHVVLLQDLLGRGSIDLDSAARQVFGHAAERNRHLVELVDICSRVQSPSTDMPLIPARYHFFVRALEGAFVCQSPSHPEGESHLLLTRHEQCPACNEEGRQSKMFESGVCVKCGATYILGITEEDEEGNTYLRWPGPNDLDLRYLLVSEGSLEAEDDEDEQAVVQDQDVDVNIDVRRLCTSCGSLAEGTTSSCNCGQHLAIPVTAAHPTRRGEPLRRCIACTGRSPAPIVLRFETGQDAPVSVIATALHQALPPSQDDKSATLIGEGRKLLSFSDSRQDAAFFAPYLDRTYSQAIQRRLIWMTAERLADQEPRFDDLVIPIRKEAERQFVLDEDDGAMRNSNRVRTWLMREILAVDRRQSLDGVGLAEISFALPSGTQVPEPLLNLGFSQDEALDLARVLIETLRLQAAVHLPEGVDIEDPAFAPRNVVTNVRGEQSGRRILSWLPTRGLNRRLDYLNKLLARKSVTADSTELLKNIWFEWLSAPGSPWLKVLRPEADRRHGQLYAIDPERIIIRPASQERPAFRCDTCRQVWWRSVDGVCPSYQCTGTLKPTQPATTDHYHHLYTSLRPIGMQVEEHTGQLSADFAAELQQKFVDGEVNVLSCSTTFELGVDVGEVQGILMRNVPPSPANYIQRAGRAGRRAGSPALTVAFAQRRNHDLHYFRNPEDLVDGQMSVPIISLGNDRIIRRHIHALAFSAFERAHVDSGGDWHRTVNSFFAAKDYTGIAPVEAFINWLRSRPTDIGDAIGRITPSAQVASELGIADWEWVDALVEPSDEHPDHGWLQRAKREVVDDLEGIGRELDEVEQQISEYRSEGQSQKAENLSGYQRALLRMERTLRERRLIDFLAQRVILPKYGFPVDTVSLDVSREGSPQAAKLDLSRDLRLGITDYAPGSQTVANGALWETAGLRIPPGEALFKHRWATCSSCGAFRTRWSSGGDELDNCENCPVPTPTSDGGIFVIPMFGFIGQRCDEKPGESRPPKAGFSQFHFDNYMSEEPPPFQSVNVNDWQVRFRTSPQGRITAINQGPGGRGFRICFSCGYAESAPIRGARPDREHPRPNSQRNCNGNLTHASLGHQFLTDVVEVQLLVPMTHQQARSTLYALLEGCPAIGISRSDVNVSLHPGQDGQSSLVLFDAVPGGAGHSKRIADRLPELLRAARRVVENCECGEDSSCYGCLRSYANQRHHDELVRGDALEILSFC